MNKTIEQLRGEIRYAIRLCQRTARLYRRAQAIGTFLAIIGGSAAIINLSSTMPAYVKLTGAILLAISGAVLIAVRPADKAAQNEMDVKRYQALMTKSYAMTIEQIEVALEEAHQTDAPEIEPLRDVAYNDVVIELNRPDCLIKLNPWQKLLSSVA